MEIVTKVILEYLGSNRRLIVPGLGAFMVKDTGERVFSDLLRNDDGVLTSLLCNEMNDMEAAVTIDRFIFEVRHELEQYGYCRLGEVGTLRIEPENGVLRLYPPVKSEEVQPEAHIPYVPAPILEGDMPEVASAEPGDEVAEAAEVAETVEDAGVEQSDEVAEAVEDAGVEQSVEAEETPELEASTLVQNESQSQPEAVVSQPEEIVAQPEAVVSQPEEMVAQPEAVVSQPEEKVEEDVRPVSAKPQPKKAKRRIKFDLVMLIAIAVILAAVALLVLGIYNVTSSDNSNNKADDRAMDKVRVETE